MYKLGCLVALQKLGALPPEQSLLPPEPSWFEKYITGGRSIVPSRQQRWVFGGGLKRLKAFEDAGGRVRYTKPGAPRTI